MDIDAIKAAIASTVDQNKVEETQRLLAVHPHAFRRGYGGQQWVQIAASRANMAMLKVLLDQGRGVNSEEDDESRFTALYDAVIAAITSNNKNCLEIIKLLEEHGADLYRVVENEQTKQPMNPLSVSIAYGKDDVAAYLRSQNAALPIEIAIGNVILENNVEEAKKLLLENPRSIHRGQGGYPWLQMAAQGKSLALAKVLLDLGCPVNAEENFANRLTALSSAIARDDLAMVRLLLEHGANPNQGRQVIGAIAGNKKNSLEMLKLMEKHGADLHRVFVNEQTNTPMNALSTAVDWGKDDVADYLRSKKAVIPDGIPGDDEPKGLGDEVVAYFKKNFGPVKPQSLIEIVPSPSGLPAIAVHVVPEANGRNHITLFTTGMSSERLATPDGEEEYQFAELFIQLPAGWKYSELRDLNWAWPIYWLRSNARYPHEAQIGFGPVTMIANDNPPRPLSPDIKFTSLLLLAEKNFVSRDGQTIQLYRMMPLFTEEYDLGRKDIGSLLRTFDRHSIPFIFQPDRPNVGLLDG